MRLCFLLLILLRTSSAAAQVGPDVWARDHLRWAEHAQAADRLRTGLVGVALVVPCLTTRTWRCVANEGLHVGVGVLSTEVTKRLTHRPRPNQQDDRSFWSEHTMLACLGTVRSKAVAICPAVGWLSIAADAHWSTDTMAGAAAGAVLTTIAWGK